MDISGIITIRYYNPGLYSNGIIVVIQWMVSNWLSMASLSWFPWSPQWRLTRRTSSTNQMPSKGLYGMRFTSVVRQLGRLPSTWPLEETWGDFPTTGKWLASDVTTCHWTIPWVQLPGHPRNHRTVGQEGRQLACVVQWIVDALHRISQVGAGKSKWLGVIIVDLPIIKIGGSFHSYVKLVYQAGYVHFQSQVAHLISIPILAFKST